MLKIQSTISKIVATLRIVRPRMDPVCEDAESVTFEKNFEYDEESCWKRLQEVIEQ